MVYGMRIESTVRTGKARAFEATARRIYDLLKEQPGFRGASLLTSVGFPGKYTSLVTWADRAAARAFVLSAACEQFYANDPFGQLATPGRPTESAEVIYNIGEPAAVGAAVVLVEWTIDPAKATEFVDSRKQVLDLRQKFAVGFQRGSLAQMLSAQGRYGLTSSFATEADLRASLTVPELAAFQQAHPASAYGGTATIELHELVLAAVPALVPA